MSASDFAAVQACTRVVLDLYAAIDAGNARRAVPLFTEDAVFETKKQRSCGVAAVTSFLGAREDDHSKRTMHVLANVRHEITSDEELTIDALLLVYRPGGRGSPPWLVEHAGPAQHTLRRVDGRWLISERRPG